MASLGELMATLGMDGKGMISGLAAAQQGLAGFKGSLAAIQAPIITSEKHLNDMAAKLVALGGKQLTPLQAAFSPVTSALASLKTGAGQLGGALTSALAPASAALKSAKAGVGQLGGAVSALQGPLALIGVGFGAFKSAEGIAGALKGVFETGRELQILSAKTGESVGSLAMLRKAFNDTGVGADAVPGAIMKLQKALGGVSEEGEPTAKGFAMLGLSIDQLKGQTAAEQLQAVGSAIAKLPDPASQAAASMKIFGREGGNMMALFSDPDALAATGAAASKTAQIYERSAGVFSRITVDLQALSGKTKGFFLGLADQIGPAILPILDEMKKIDLTGIGEGVGQALRAAMAAFQSGEIGELLGASFRVAGLELSSVLMAAMQGVGAWLGGEFELVGKTLGALFSNLPTALDALGEGLVGAIQGAGAVMLDVFKAPIIVLQAGIQKAMEELMEGMGKIPGLGKMTGLDTFHAKSYAEIKDAREKEGASMFGFGSAELAEKSRGHLAKAGEGFKNVFGGINFGAELKAMFASVGAALSSVATDTPEMTKAKADLAAMVQRLAPNAAAGEPGTKKGPGGGEGPDLDDLGKGHKMEAGDRLARIGGFIGAGGGPALDYARRTAGGVEKMAGKLDALATKLVNTGGSAAVWAS